MPPKIYVTAYPAGDFRAMPALGGAATRSSSGSARFRGTPRTVCRPSGDGTALRRVGGGSSPLLDAASLTALRTGAAAVLAAETLGKAGCDERQRSSARA